MNNQMVMETANVSAHVSRIILVIASLDLIVVISNSMMEEEDVNVLMGTTEIN